ncbi:hypothetical protein LSH36_383g00011 [Paralvinella palmiformis]|uniref:FCH domain-containing protein n=1 Tax=Paralvinella palmiformis TaxID=53620 RepID=A0AAD9JDK0_9ANNE|nr:hypothetical protein LSH36_383g00011 [Paralvinella palmiformis]
MAQKKCVNHQRKANGVGTLDRLMSKSMESFGDLSESCHNIVWSNNMKGWPLKDQFENISGHTQKGIEFCERYSHFIKERCSIENEYASRLKKLVKNYKPKKTEPEKE